MNVLVVGAGAMGRWFARTLATNTTGEVAVAFADADPDAAGAAADTEWGRAVPLDTDETFDAVCVAVPMPAAADAIETHADRATRAVLDVTGSAAGPVTAMRTHAPDCERVSLHPLFAPENAPGNVAVVVDEPGPVTDDVRAALAAAGNHCFETTPAEHDRAMETVQSRAHAAILAFGLAARDVPDAFQTPVSDALFDLVEQVGGGDPRVYADIQATFDGADDVAAAARDIAAADTETFADLYREATDR
ncbi:prephenate dehydrogenase/arogenate dehydrogenase family protein [Halorientalis litorea]|jgi:prephenate dehydrogenase|uniref:prephenate dehydrogenase/arogenate dehydrogenase family protein n=1 Tax=Halorientalis litorea TaxID=2931977 RepID=UPI001FF165F9|nr:prephenate dehydrogenase/arogenate dehydrogenase family protein [Halorientalis litorea]